MKEEQGAVKEPGSRGQTLASEQRCDLFSPNLSFLIIKMGMRIWPSDGEKALGLY